MQTLDLTIVICTHNRANLLKHTIASINSASRPTNCNLSILVIANACRDKTLSELQHYIRAQDLNDDIQLEYREEPRPGKSHALNLALKKIASGYIAFVDDDHKVDSHYFISIVSAISKHPECLLFCGQIIPDWTGEEAPWVHDTGQYKIYPLPVPHFELGATALILDQNQRIPGGGNLIAHINLFQLIGGFCTDLGPSGHNLLGGEDSDFVIRSLEAGQALRYEPSIVQFHYVDLERFKLHYLLQKSFQRSRSITLARNPDSHSIPLYQWRKLINYSAGVLFSFSWKKVRFYLMRIASTLGEMSGCLGRIR
ncbi:MAG: glycosyltransferase family 2 protein [Candidatus Reddybacter sp.]